jgi:hypothetical protein
MLRCALASLVLLVGGDAWGKIDPVNSKETKENRVAIVMAGSARSFIYPAIHWSIKENCTLHARFSARPWSTHCLLRPQ